MNPAFRDERITLYAGDCREVMTELDASSVDAIVTDPPYELGFMGKHWDASGVAYDAIVWREALRVLKPGGHLVAFGGSRTYHRLAGAIEDAGFEIRDCIMWMYGSGFPKSLDISKAIDKAKGLADERGYIPTTGGLHGGTGNTVGRFTGKQLSDEAVSPEAKQWQGYGTALKPAYEPAVLAKKPVEYTIAQNAMKYGAGGLNIDGTRIATDEVWEGSENPDAEDGVTWAGMNAQSSPSHPDGRWPTNVILSHGEGCDEECEPGCPIAMLDDQSGFTQSQRRNRPAAPKFYSETDRGMDLYGVNDEGGASRFFYTAKASRSEREAGLADVDPQDARGTVGRKPGSAGTHNAAAGAGRSAGQYLTEQDSINAWVNEALEAARQTDTALFLQRVTEGFTWVDDSEWNMMSSGNLSAGQSPMDSRSTMSTEISSTTESTTSPPSTQPITSGFIQDALSRMASGLSPVDYVACVNRLIERTGTSPEKAGHSMDAAASAISARLSEISNEGGLPSRVRSGRRNTHPT